MPDIPNHFHFLKKHPLFSNFSDEQLSKILAIAGTHSYNAEEVILHEGDQANEIYIVMEGEIEILKQEEKSQYFYRIVTLSTGAVLGEMSLVEDTPRAATVRALTLTTLLSLPILSLREFAKNDSADIQLIYYKLVEKIAHELCSRLRIANQMVVGSYSQAANTGEASSFFTKMLSF